MNPVMSRKTEIIIGIVIVIVILVITGVAVWYFFYRAEPPIGPEISGEFPTTGEVAIPPKEPTTTMLGEGEAFKPILRQLTTTPVAGAVLGGRSGTALVRYTDRATGNSMEIPAEGGTARRITNTTIPKVYEALWAKNGQSVVLRYLKEDGETIETFLGAVKSGTSGGEGELVGSFLPSNITAISGAPDGSELFYIREDNDGAVGVRTDFVGKTRAALWRSTLREWLPISIGTTYISILSKPSALAEGMLRVLNRNTEKETVPLRNIFGLTALPNKSLTKILYSESANNTFTLRALDVKSGGARTLFETTAPEKCVFLKNDTDAYCAVPKTIPIASYPDAWYQGIVSFQDDVWKLNADNKGDKFISPISEEAATAIDAINLSLSSDEKFLIFMNKTDGTLWSLQLAP